MFSEEMAVLEFQERSTPRGWLCAALLVSLLLSAAPAAAQQDTPLAKQHYKLGAELYARADFQGALDQFNRAYQLSRRPALQWNIARCRESLGHYGLAIKTYEAYLTSNPPNAAMVRTRITNLRKLINRRKAASRPAKPVPLEPPSSGRPLRLAGWVLVGAGGASLVAGVVLGAMASGKASDLEEANASGAARYRDWADDYDGGEALQTGQVAALIVGGALAATGVTLLVVDALGQRRERRAWIAPKLTPTGGGLHAGFSF